jgi:hypothetical protein
MINLKRNGVAVAKMPLHFWSHLENTLIGNKEGRIMLKMLLAWLP